MDDRSAVGAAGRVDEPAQRRAHARVRARATASGRCASIDSLVVAEWLKGGAQLGTVPALRAMFNDARRPHAGMLDRRQPVRRARAQALEGTQARAAAGARRGRAADRRRGRAHAAELRRLPVHRVLLGDAARRARRAASGTTSTSRPARRRSAIERQWNVKREKITPPKHGSTGTIAMVEPVRDRLLTLPRESEWVFTTLRGTTTCRPRAPTTGTASAARSGSATTALYEATRHYFAWYLLNVAGAARPRRRRAAAPRRRRHARARAVRAPRRRDRARANPGRVPFCRAGHRAADHQPRGASGMIDYSNRR